MLWMSRMKNRVVVTGASGFIGRVLVNKLFENSLHPLRVVIRNKTSIEYDKAIDVSVIPVFDKNTDWSPCLNDCKVIIHMAARVHILKDRESDPLSIFRQVNVEATMNLAQQAVKAGVKRFVFISSIKVNGEETCLETPFQPDTSYVPTDPYGLSKYEAETQLISLGKKTGMEIVIIRPPLVYGPGVKGNFERLISWLKKGYPLPFAAVNNKRSFISVLNLVNFITCCIEHPAAANQVFLVSDGEDISTSDLLKKMGNSLASPAKLFSLPVWMLSGMGILMGKRAEIKRLCGSLQVDISKACDLLDWKPVISMDDALVEMAQQYIER